MNIQALKDFLDHSVIPKIKKKPKTFLGIAKQPHYENVMSNIYAFYFKVEEVHGMQDLFINSLLQVINSKPLGKQKQMTTLTDFDIATEQPTKKGGRIDLLLSNSEYAVIIENKVYHYLNNNLDDYWDSVKVKDEKEENKIGVILSLNTLTVKHPHFINITHLELMKIVMENSGNYLIDLEDKYIVFLKDFYQNIINLSKIEMDTKDLEFYFSNQLKINDVKDFLFAVRKHISNQVELACEPLNENLKLQIPKGINIKRLRYYQSSKNSNLMITVVFNELLKTEKRIFLIIELKNNLLDKRERYQSISFTDEEKQLLHPDFFTKKGTWAHFAVKSYILNNDEIKNLSVFIIDKLTEDGLLSVYKKLNGFI